jgi:hypothetical protein
MCVTELEFTVLSLPLLYGFRKCKQRAGIEDKINTILSFLTYSRDRPLIVEKMYDLIGRFRTTG